MLILCRHTNGVEVVVVGGATKSAAGVRDVAGKIKNASTATIQLAVDVARYTHLTEAAMEFMHRVGA